MKELTIEEKAKRYDEAIERAKLSRVQLLDIGEEATEIEHIFPELKESEDEKIRKAIHIYLDWLDGRKDYAPKGEYSIRDMIAWLEKQSTSQVRTGLEWVNTIDDACDKRYSEEYAHGEYCHEQSFKWGFQEGVDWLEKQCEPQDKGEISDGYHTFNELYYYRLLYNAAFFNMLPKEWVHKSKKHNDGEECFGGGWFIVMANLPTGQISNHYELKDWDLFQIPEKEVADKWDGHTPQEAADRLYKYLLEKQGERKFNVGDIITNGEIVYRVDGIIKNGLGQYCYSLVDVESEKRRLRYLTVRDSREKMEETTWLCEQVDKSFEKQEEQKPADKCKGCNNFKGCITCSDGDQWAHITETYDKAEPRFKVGDWCIDNTDNTIFQITKVLSNLYYYRTNEGKAYSCTRDSIERDAHLWTIEDANDGDVLAFDNDNIVIFKDLYNATTLHSYCHIEDGIFGISNWWEGEGFHPATKEQCDTLERAMTNAGYRWNKEELKLEKI